MIDAAVVTTNYQSPEDRAPRLRDLKRGQWAQVIEGQSKGKIVYRPNRWIAYHGMSREDREFAMYVGDTTLLTFENHGDYRIRILEPGEVVTVTMGRNSGERD